ncbi:hypothetical protein LTR62_007797 [Meristemomyces frigidus]|uniref:Uncharacterized protein n=1 Tax=Meristemomyces frigidus TaxID=1508187 RepID=A0AAN7YM64_9PEZI|nr:hypothetical protein LTR62_007797 [Meristemomyces frigidus]
MNVFKNLFKERGVKDVITLFHNPSSPASIRAHTILKQAAGNAHATATVDQAADHSKQSKLERTNFELDVVEEAPTTDQLTNVLEYLGPSKAGNVVKDATGSSDAMRKFNAAASAFQRPVTVDWTHGRAVVGDDESELLKLIRSAPKEGSA